MATSGEGRHDGAAPEESFHVEDRRRFAGGGEPRPNAGEDIPLPGGGVLQGHPSETDADVELPVGFGDLVHPFVLMGLAGLGVLPGPEGRAAEVNLQTARAAIDLLELLRAKTEGNRAADENALLDRVLYELKMQFVEARERSR